VRERERKGREKGERERGGVGGGALARESCVSRRTGVMRERERERREREGGVGEKTTCGERG